MTDAPTPEDDTTDENTPADESALDETALDDLDEQARRTEQHAKEAGILPDDEPKFHESGDIDPDLDDQTIAPPG